MGIEVGSDTPLGSIIVGAVMLLFGGAGWYFAWKGSLAASASSQWQPVDAKILRARATQDAHGDWSPDIAYEYVIAGERYESSQVRILRPTEPRCRERVRSHIDTTQLNRSEHTLIRPTIRRRF
jgi:Protein of unknown function (DUF3592)